MSHSAYPEEWSVNGEPASEQAVADMETLATNLLAEFPGDYNRQYGYRTPDGSIALFSTHAF